MGANQPALEKTGKSNQAPGPGGPAEQVGQPPVVQSPITAAPKFVRQAPAAPAFRFGGGPLGGFSQGVAPSPMGMTPQGGFAPQGGMSVAQLAQGYNPFAQQQQAAQPQYGGPSPGMKGDEGQLAPGVAAARRQAAMESLARTKAGGGEQYGQMKGALSTGTWADDESTTGDSTGNYQAYLSEEERALEDYEALKEAGLVTTQQQQGWSDDEYMDYWSKAYNRGDIEKWEPDARTIDRGEEMRRLNDESKAAASRALADMYGQAYGGSIPQAEFAQDFSDLTSHYNSQEQQMLLDETMRAENEFAAQETEEAAAANQYFNDWKNTQWVSAEEGDILSIQFTNWAQSVMGKFLSQGASAEWINRNVLPYLATEWYEITNTPIHQGNQGDVTNIEPGFAPQKQKVSQDEYTHTLQK